MKRFILYFIFTLCLTLLAGCGQTTAGDSVEEPPYFSTFRVVDGAETGMLLLAETGSAATQVYTLELSELNFEPAWEQPLRNGQMLNVYFETTLETWPAQFGGISSLEPLDSGFDDLCALYLRVLEDLWSEDAGLNDDLTYLGVDLSNTRLSPAEGYAIGWAFAQKHGVEWVRGTYEDLVEQGYISGKPIRITGSGVPLSEETGAKFWSWEDGCMFSIEETDQPVVFNLPNLVVDDERLNEDGSVDMTAFNVRNTVAFTAHKWRSSLGAYWFNDCTAVQDNMGVWGDYTVGGRMIS